MSSNSLTDITSSIKTSLDTKLNKTDSIDWTSVSNTPTTFPPTGHRHNWSDIDSRPAIPSNKRWYPPVAKGSIANGTCTHDTLVRVYAGGNVTNITVNGVNMNRDRTYHDEQGHGTIFMCPAGYTWSVSGSSGTWYMEFR